MDRLRAATASLLSGLAGGARRLEHWTSRGTRPIFLGLIAIAILVAGSLAVVHESRAFFGGHGGPRERMELRAGPGGLAGHPVPKPEQKPAGKPEAPRGPDAPAPPQPPR